MKFLPTDIPDVISVQVVVHGDDRGFFLESWHKKKFAASGIDADFVQDNHSKSVKGTLRGLHYQTKHAQGKLVRVISGSIFDVAVDLRRSSSTFGKWVAVTLSEQNKTILWVPAGFAHGFYVVSQTAEILYKCTDIYAPEFERTLIWNDPDLAIDWPLDDSGGPLLSDKDKSGVPFRLADTFP